MKTIEIQGRNTTSRILVGERLQNVKKYINPAETVIITDQNVNFYYHQNFPKCNIIELGTGEKIKNLRTVNNIYEKLLEYGTDRTSFILGIGGGVVCDIAGFAASTFMRGIEFGFISTSLLSQVDASVGGKNGVNFMGYKNIVGVFSQPEFVICDFEMLKTLPKKEILSGFAEIVKHAAIGNETFFSYLEKNYNAAYELDMVVLGKLIYDSIIVKSEIVKKDEIEKDERRKLNFGHTFGHAIEKITGFSHGKSISIGMALASHLSVKRGMLKESQHKRILNILKNLMLPTEIDMNKEKLLDAIYKDKKKVRDKIKFVYLKDIGKPAVKDITFDELEAVLYDMC